MNTVNPCACHFVAVTWPDCGSLSPCETEPCIGIDVCGNSDAGGVNNGPSDMR